MIIPPLAPGLILALPSGVTPGMGPAMYRTPVARVVVRCVVTIGIVLTMLLAGAAPSDFMGAPTSTLVLGR
jgi:hypothetical protein